ncbi:MULTISPECIES: 30S ribosome-binding factor RbfA [Mycoplasma]|uniref:Ribosome-binding factor A n=3 Tax=Mycoplasma TaxID=2093 RepID=S6G703_9MOLU|nr:MULTISPECIES: 30S ribosome-binding factor RbfA [Mycoplasma]AJM71751.1 ribosome-binding factor A [Mycoplasma yeatsii GM274B]EOA07423.1 Ribosome-binding factor A [Mycoplasma yeatsii 13926]MDQ0568120.1 ribosome-binding factor A [Mycoplasma yeatsii]UWD35287.1 30S ribosome-binding factor RbfA [Mycoplasma cottewii]
MSNLKAQKKKESQMLRELNLILQRELQNPVLNTVSVAEVRLSADGSHAKIFYSFLPINEEISKENVGKEIEEGLKEIRMILASKLDWRSVPNLNFEYDESLDRANHINEILAEQNSK